MFLPSLGRQYLRKVYPEWRKEDDLPGSCGLGKFQARPKLCQLWPPRAFVTFGRCP